MGRNDELVALVMIYISQIYGGPELVGTPFDRAVGTISRLRGAPVDPGLQPSIDMVFHVPGSHFTPDYSGVRTGRLSRRKRMLQIQIAVPREILGSTEGDIIPFLLDSLREGVRIAALRFRKANIAYDKEAHLGVIARIQSALVH